MNLPGLKGQVHIPAGDVSGTFFTVSSPYFIDGNVVIPEDSTLFIQPGVQIWITGAYQVLVYGRLIAEGTADSVITWQPSAEDWNSIWFYRTDSTGQDTSYLEHCRITGCYSLNGGGLYLESSGRTVIADCEIHDNTASFGGGVKLIDSDATFIQCEFHHNTSLLDGGGFHVNGGSPSFINCTFHDNESEFAGGGGLILSGGTVIFEDCVFENNVSNGSGGGFYARNVGQLVVRNSSFITNTCYANEFLSSGGAIGIKDGSNALVEYCMFEDNYCGSFGGAISTSSPTQVISSLFYDNYALDGGAVAQYGTLFSGPVRVVNCTFHENEALYDGSQVLVEQGEMLLANSILWAGDTASMIHLETTQGYAAELTILFSNVRGGVEAVTETGSSILHWDEGNISAEPHFLDALNDDFHLTWRSPCIEAGDPSPSGYGISAFDLDGNPRVVNEQVDMGCYEYLYPVNIYEEKEPASPLFTVFPVPCREHLHIRTPQRSYEVRVYDLYGRLVLEEKDSPGTIDLRPFPAGQYLVRLSSGQGVESFVIPVVF